MMSPSDMKYSYKTRYIDTDFWRLKTLKLFNDNNTLITTETIH